MSRKYVNNTVFIRFPTGISTKLSVNGILGDICQSKEIAADTYGYGVNLPVEFSDFSIQFGSLPTVRLPLPRPKGQLKTTFCDGDLRISRGGRGGIFIAKRINK